MHYRKQLPIVNANAIAITSNYCYLLLESAEIIITIIINIISNLNINICINRGKLQAVTATPLLPMLHMSRVAIFCDTKAAWLAKNNVFIRGAGVYWHNYWSPQLLVMESTCWTKLTTGHRLHYIVLATGYYWL